jgi:hypothetical protein
MNPATPQTELPPSTRLRKAVFGGAHYLIVAALNRAASKSNVLLVIATIWFSCASIALGANRYVDPASASPAPPYTSWTTAAHTIPAALGVCTPGDVVIVANGVYTLTSQIIVPGGVWLTCLSGPANATINGNGVTRCVYMPGAASGLGGFTITGGKAQTGAGIYCVGGTVTNCVITNNQAVGDAPKGGGVYCDGGTISHCVISGNSVTSTNTYLYGAFAEGGGIYAVNQSQIDHSTVVNNSLNGYYSNGGGINANGGSVQYCTVSGNTAYGHWYADGGGVYMTAGLIRNCLITDNNAHTDRGAYSANWADGGGVYFNGGGTLESSTVYGNTLDGDMSTGGGLTYGGQIRNTIIYGNTATARMTADGPNYYLNSYGPATFDHCCSTPLPAGVGNIASAPGFMSGGYRLDTGSPCIDTGTNQAWMATATDLDGNPRIANGTVDMGVYERSVSAPQLTIIRSVTNVILRWPTNAAGFTLQSTTNLVSLAVWATVSPAPVVVNGQNAVTNPISGTRKFYRLSK